MTTNGIKICLKDNYVSKRPDRSVLMQYSSPNTIVQKNDGHWEVPDINYDLDFPIGDEVKLKIHSGLLLF